MPKVILVICALAVLALLTIAGCRPTATLVPMTPGSTASPLSPLLTPFATQVVPEATHKVLPGPARTPFAASGIHLKATIGPTCPGPERPGQLCIQPYVGMFVVTDSTGAEVARASTDQNGTATIDLLPGDYTITPKIDGKFPSGAPTAVTVLPGQYLEISIDLDSGIR
jgi:hypothetical protein